MQLQGLWRRGIITPTKGSKIGTLWSYCKMSFWVCRGLNIHSAEPKIVIETCRWRKKSKIWKPIGWKILEQGSSGIELCLLILKMAHQHMLAYYALHLQKQKNNQVLFFFCNEFIVKFYCKDLFNFFGVNSLFIKQEFRLCCIQN